MILSDKTLSGSERAVYNLKKLYEAYGYSHYKMSKFEEYDLYLRNKSFLVSDHIITFTDTGGKLMALKPDVTLSIVKNSPERETGVRKVYYNENVYRVPRGALTFKEIMQAGLECIGEIDRYSVAEVLILAAKSLESISQDYVLDVSHMGIVSSIIDGMGLTASARAEVISCLGEKNIHGVSACLASSGADAKKAEMLKQLMAIKGTIGEMLDILEGSECYADALEMAEILSSLEALGYKIRIDFSVTDDTQYYSGIVFKGFIKGIPTSVLTGGRYDNLMRNLGKQSGAIGFAVYIDLLGELDCEQDEYDADAFVLYGDNTSVKELVKVTDSLVSDGKSVETGRLLPDGRKYKEIIKVGGENDGNA